MRTETPTFPHPISVKNFFWSVGGVMLFELLAGRISIQSHLVVLGVLRMVEIMYLMGLFGFSENGLSGIGLSSDHWKTGVVKGIIWSLSFGILVLIGFGILWLSGTNPLRLIRSRIPKTAVEFFLFMVLNGLIAPIAEEIFFRGVVYGFFRRWGVAAALMLSSLIFAGMHPVRLPVTQMIGGILFATSYEIEKNLFVPLTIHVLGNTVIAALSMI